MKKNILEPERQKMLVAYIEHVHGMHLSYDCRGRYIDSVLRFLKESDEVSRRGWNRYKKTHTETLVLLPFMRDAICEFLALHGMGYRQVNGNQTHKRLVDKIEKREIRQRETINGFLLWLQNEKEYSPHSLRVYRDTVQGYYSYFDDFTQDNCRRFINKLVQEGKAPATIQLRITGLVKLGEYFNKPVKLKRPKLVKKLSVENVPTEKEYYKLLEYTDAHNPKFAYIIRLMGTTGCRVSELVQFTYEQVQSGSTMLKGKGSKFRHFFFTKQMQEMSKGKSGIICMNKYGVPMSTTGISTMLKDIGEKAGIAREKMHPHAFRHFFAKMYLKKTKDVVGLAEILGHAKVDTTRLYLQKSLSEQKREVSRVVSW